MNFNGEKWDSSPSAACIRGKAVFWFAKQLFATSVPSKQIYPKAPLELGFGVQQHCLLSCFSRDSLITIPFLCLPRGIPGPQVPPFSAMLPRDHGSPPPGGEECPVYTLKDFGLSYLSSASEKLSYGWPFQTLPQLPAPVDSQVPNVPTPTLYPQFWNGQSPVSHLFQWYRYSPISH